jgi:hypothetical protein
MLLLLRLKINRTTALNDCVFIPELGVGANMYIGQSWILQKLLSWRDLKNVTISTLVTKCASNRSAKNL